MASPLPPSQITGPYTAEADANSPSLAPIMEGPGTVIGPYKLLQQIGEGGFGVVYMADQEKPVRRTVALKIIKPGMDTSQVIARFESERQALALMDHPNIARVFDAGATVSGRPFFVMELVKGVPITEYCDKSHVTPAGRLKLFIDVCHAIQHAHHKGIIHRDIKPSNVLVTLHDGLPVVKVIDFGVAKATVQKLTERTLFTTYGQMVGTPAYMSPEQAEMSGLDIDTRSDVYSLGVLLYELLTGTTPLESKRLREAGYAEMQRLIREEEPPRPSTRLSSLGDSATLVAGNRGLDVRHLVQLLADDLDWIVIKALEKDRNRRYGTPENLAQDIDRYLRREAILARPPSTWYKLRKFAQRNRAAVLTAALVVGALILGTCIATWQAVRATRAEASALVAEEEAKAERDKALKAEAVAISQSDLSYDALGDLVLKIQMDLDEAPGGRHVRKELLEDTMKKLHRLHESPTTSDRLFRRYASAHMQLGEILWGLNRRNEAEEEYKKAGEYASRAFQAFPTSDKAKANMAANHNRMGDVEVFYHKRVEPGRKEYEAALPLWQGLADKMVAFPDGDPALPELERINLVDSEEAVADTYDRMGIIALRFDYDFAKAEEWFNKSLVIRKRHVERYPSRQHRVAVGASYIYLAELAYQHGNLAKSLSLYEELLKQRQATFTERSWSLKARRELADAQGKLADVLIEVKRNEEGHKLNLASRDLFQQVRAAEPDDPTYRGLVAHAYYRCGTSFLRLGDPSSALHEFQEGLKLRQGAYDEVKDPRQRLNMQPQLMFALVRSGKHAEAAELAASVRKNLTSMPIHLVEAGSCYGLCMAAVGAGRPPEQLTDKEKEMRAEYYRLALACFEEAVKKQPDSLLGLETGVDLDPLVEVPGFMRWLESIRRPMKTDK